MKELSSKEVHALPYTVLLDKKHRRAAAYNETHRLITEEASNALIDYALRPGHHSAPYDPTRQDPRGIWRPLPAWATADVQERLVVVWVRRGGTPDEELCKMPRK